LVGVKPDSVNTIVSQRDKNFQDILAKIGLIKKEGFEDFDDLAFDSPVVGGQLLKERFDDLVFKSIFVHFGSEELEVFSNSQSDLTVRIFHEVEDVGKEALSHEIVADNAADRYYISGHLD